MEGVEQICPGRLNIATVAKRFRMDCETPVSLYLKLALEKPYSFILESVEHGQHSGRHSFIGWDPILKLAYSPETLHVTGALSGDLHTSRPLDALKALFEKINMLDEQTIPNARGGLVGHIGYDSIRLVEDIGPYKTDGGPTAPWIELILPRCLLVFDHLDHSVTLLSHQVVTDSPDSARQAARRRLQETVDKIRAFSVANASVEMPEIPVSAEAWRSNLDKREYCELVLRAKRHIVDGDIFQAVLSRAMRREFHGQPFEIYRVLRQINPSPYMYFLKQGDRVIVGGSPESLVTLENGVLATKPIAGTRPRGKDIHEDLALEADLLADQKEIAEHVMLVDLGRNDLGRVAKVGSVSVPRFKQIERYSHVMHIVSLVEAQLRDELHPIDALMSVFPAGTLSGAPKIRAMQIINDFEPEDRQIYGGAIGFFDFAGNMDSCIAIRTAIVEDGEVRVQAGAGIVADSVPEKEFDETTHKMMSMIAAVEKAIWLHERRQ